MIGDGITFITNEGVLPSQFFPDAQNLSGCQRLLMAIFSEALDTLRQTSRTHNQHKADMLWNAAVEWVSSDDERYASFVHCCHYLGADPNTVRRALRKHYGLELRIPYRQPYVPNPDRRIRMLRGGR